MNTNDTNDTKAVGNNKSTADKFRSRKYVFTINNYNMTQKTQLSKLCQKSKNYIFGEEVGDAGTPHLQGYIEFKNPVYRNSLKNAIGGEFYIDGAKGDWKDNLNYCSKDGKFETNMEIYNGPVIELNTWEKYILSIIDEPPDDRSIYWFWEPDGCQGKTTFQKWLFFNREGVVTLGGKASDMKNAIINYLEKNKKHPKIVLINIPKSVEHLSYTGIEEIKDMYFFSGKYEGGMICGPNPHLLVFANIEPDYGKMSEDRWKVKNLNDFNLL